MSDFEQEDLLAYAETIAHARNTDPGTSHLAAASVNMRRSQQQVLALLQMGPATDLELIERAVLADVLISDSGLRTRRHELVDAGLVVDTGQRVRLPSGRLSTVWQVAS